MALDGPMIKETVAFFDLDLTLLTVNSGKLWIQRERRQGRLDILQMLQAGMMLMAYRLGVIDMEAAMRKALVLYRGMPEKQLDQETSQWFQQEVAHRVAPGAWTALQRHRQAGHRLVLLTSTSPYLSAAACRHMDLHHWICSTYEVREGVFTGEPISPICYGRGKVVLAERYAAKAGVDLGRSFFYSDSFTDVPMLERVGRPRVVNPDLRLRFYARRRRWPVLNWRGTTAPPGF